MMSMKSNPMIPKLWANHKNETLQETHPSWDCKPVPGSLWRPDSSRRLMLSPVSVEWSVSHAGLWRTRQCGAAGSLVGDPGWGCYGNLRVVGI